MEKRRIQQSQLHGKLPFQTYGGKLGNVVRKSQRPKKDPNDQQHCYDYSVFFLTLSQLGHARGGLTVSGRHDTAEMIPCPRL